MMTSRQHDPSESQTIAKLNANWIWIPHWIDSSQENTAGRLVTFTHQIHLNSKPKSALLHLSADTRYKLHVNRTRVAVGPARGSPYLWYFDSVDISLFLRPGDNEIRIKVLRYFAANRAAMPFGRTSFPGLTVWGLIEDGSHALEICSKEIESWRAQVCSELRFPTGLVDDVFLHIYERVSTAVSTAQVVPMAYAFRTLNGDLLPWRLQPRLIPLAEESPAIVQAVRRTAGPVSIETWSQHLCAKTPLQLAAGSAHSVDLQADVHSTAFLEWAFKSDSDSEIRIKATYSEGYEHEPPSYPFFRSKGDRLEPEGNHIIGPFDEVTLSAPAGQIAYYRPFWFRTFRIIRLELYVGVAPVDLVSFNATQTNHPFGVKASWHQLSDPQTKDMWDVSIRTLRNCMFDGYSDCPFYEQLQYSMDSRAVGLFHYLLAGDDRLMRQAILHFASSTTLEGLPQSRFPSHVNQLIAGFPLYWILKICDHHLYFGDVAFARSLMPRIDGVLEFFDRHIDARGLVSGLPDDLWQFVDWVNTWHATDEHPDKGVPSSGRNNNCHTYFSLLLAYVLRQAASLAVHVGRPGFAKEYNSRADSLCVAVRQHCYDGQHFTDSTLDVVDELSYSQHCQIWAILSGAAPKEDFTRLIADSFANTTPIKYSRCSYMMRFYALRAFALAGDEVYESQWNSTWDPWRKMLDNNLTTWEEDDVRQRSDCHAWGSLPIYEFCVELAGVHVIAPGASKVLFKPRLRLSPAIEAVVAVGHGNSASVQWLTIQGTSDIEVSLRLERAVEICSQLPDAKVVEHGKVDDLVLRWTQC